MVESAGADQTFNFRKLSLCQCFTGRKAGKKLFADDINPVIGALGREPAHHQQLPRLSLIVQGAQSCGIPLFQKLHDPGGFFLVGHGSLSPKSK